MSTALVLSLELPVVLGEMLEPRRETLVNAARRMKPIDDRRDAPMVCDRSERTIARRRLRICREDEGRRTARVTEKKILKPASNILAETMMNEESPWCVHKSSINAVVA